MKKEDLEKLQKIQMDNIGYLDISIITRADQMTTFFTMTSYPYSRKLYSHKLHWGEDNTEEFEKIISEIEYEKNKEYLKLDQ